jgi:hypothetical protein
MTTDHTKRYTGPERRRRFDRTPRDPAGIIGRARVPPGCARHLLGVDPLQWYDVVDRNPESLTTSLDGYVWVRVDGRILHVWAAHLEIQRV